MKNPNFQISLSSLFFSSVFSATKRSISACQALLSVWFNRKSPPFGNPHKPSTIFSVRSSISSAMDTPFNVNLVSLLRGKIESVVASKEMEASVAAVERILDYQFKNKRLLEEALTHSSYTDSSSYQRLEFIGDAALGCAFSNYVFLSYPDLDPGQLSLIRAANISTEKLARVAIRHELHRFVRHNAAALHEKVQDFVFATRDEDDAVSYGGSVKAPKILADIVESVAAAVYVDCGFDLQALWVVFRHILEPIVTLEDLQQQPQPVTMLFEVCQKKGKQVDIKYWRKGLKNIVSVFVDGKFVASSSSEQKETAKLHAAKEALRKLTQSGINTAEGTDITMGEFSGVYEIDGAKQRLHELCGKKKWPKPCYRVENEMGPAHNRRFICSVRIETTEGTLFMPSDMKSKVKDAENCAASSMLQKLNEYL